MQKKTDECGSDTNGMNLLSIPLSIYLSTEFFSPTGSFTAKSYVIQTPSTLNLPDKNRVVQREMQISEERKAADGGSAWKYSSSSA